MNDEIDDFILQHATTPKRVYDPVKAREYYLRTRKLKGRQTAKFSKPTVITKSKPKVKSTRVYKSPKHVDLTGYTYKDHKWYNAKGLHVANAKTSTSGMWFLPGAPLPKNKKPSLKPGGKPALNKKPPVKKVVKPPSIRERRTSKPTGKPVTTKKTAPVVVNPQTTNLSGYTFKDGKWFDKSGAEIGTAKDRESPIVIAPGTTPPPDVGGTNTPQEAGQINQKERAAKVEEVKRRLEGANLILERIRRNSNN